MPEKAKLQFRRGTAAQWDAANPVLSDGTPGFATDTGVLKIGDGVKTWKNLPPIIDETGLSDWANRTIQPQLLTQAADITALQDAVGQLGGLTEAQVLEILNNLGPTLGSGNNDVQPLLDALAGKPNATVADVQAAFAGIYTAITEAVATQAITLPDKIRLNTRDAADPATVTIEAINLTGDRTAVDVDISPQAGGKLTVAGKRVLTEDDALTGGDDPRVQDIIDILAQNTNATLTDAGTYYGNYSTRLNTVEERVGQTIDWADEQFNDLRAQLATLTGLTPEQEQAISDALDFAQGVVNILGGKPQGGGTLADVAAVFGNLGATFQTQLEDAVTSITGEFQTLLDAIGGKPGSTMQDVQGFFANMQQAVGEALASIWKAAPDKLTLNVKSANATDKVTIASWQQTPHPPAESRAVDVDITPYGDGKLLVNGKRVLTVDDALEAGGGGINQAALEAAVQAATAPLLARIEALETEAQKFVHLEYMQEQFGNFNDLLSADIGGVTQLALAEQKKLQALVDVIGGVINCDLDTVKRIWAEMNRWMGVADIDIRNLKGDVEALADMFNQIQNLINEVVEYVITEYATKVESRQGDDAVLAEVTKINEGLAAFEAEVANAVPAMINEGFEERVPQILEALSAHLENVLSIFTSGGTPGQVVTPAQLTQLLADIARDYATKDQVTTALAPYAKKDDADQELVAKAITTRGVLFSITDEALAPIDYPDYGTRLSIIPKDATSVDDAGIVVVHTDLADLVPNAVRELPAAEPWAPVTYANGASGTVEAKVINGAVVFRGQLVKTHGGDPTHVFTLPVGIPAPTSLLEVAVPGEETGVGYRIASVRVQTDGRVFLTAPQRVTHTSMSDLSYLVEQR